MSLQIVSVELDEDTYCLRLRLSNGSEYLITNAGHARILKERISPGGRLSAEQCDWLAKHAVVAPEAISVRLRQILAQLRLELRR